MNSPRYRGLSVAGSDLKPPANGPPVDVVGSYIAWSQTDRTKRTLSSMLSNMLPQTALPDSHVENSFKRRYSPVLPIHTGKDNTSIDSEAPAAFDTKHFSRLFILNNQGSVIGLYSQPLLMENSPFYCGLCRKDCLRTPQLQLHNTIAHSDQIIDCLREYASTSRNNTGLQNHLKDATRSTLPD
ncbi:hypothetical protein K457DRAFT_13921 [Linnemannia elongata AG-77]|uniref:C2H2-type domain-containing protein n=1 Tax=Linnemannia elongata AG-77 TaxID=1314771 RepID=A0A197KB39_9FUNG|nr:hypothetical protein K457DRAFT_13921 [Linnemannia elongata AG-77]